MGIRKLFDLMKKVAVPVKIKKIVFWIVKEYCLDKITMNVLSGRKEIRHEDSVLCFVTKKINICKNHQEIPIKIKNVVLDCVSNSPKDHGGWLYVANIWQLPSLNEPLKSLTDEKINYFDIHDPKYPRAYI